MSTACAVPDGRVRHDESATAADNAVRRLGGSAVPLMAVATAAVCAGAFPPLAFSVAGPLAFGARAVEQL
jgi:hypothetical protein